MDTKPKRKPSAYSLYVKEKYPSVRHLPLRDRFREIAKMWKQEKNTPA